MECQHSAYPTISFHNPQFAEYACWSESTTACLPATAWATSTIASLFSSLPGSGLACSTAPTSTPSTSGLSLRMCLCPPCSSLSSLFSSSCLGWTCLGLRYYLADNLDDLNNSHPGCNILLVRPRCCAASDDSPAGLPCAVDPEGLDHLWGQP